MCWTRIREETQNGRPWRRALGDAATDLKNLGCNSVADCAQGDNFRFHKGKGFLRVNAYC